jgi:hypothetical protein
MNDDKAVLEEFERTARWSSVSMIRRLPTAVSPTMGSSEPPTSWLTPTMRGGSSAYI